MNDSVITDKKRMIRLRYAVLFVIVLLVAGISILYFKYSKKPETEPIVVDTVIEEPVKVEVTPAKDSKEPANTVENEAQNSLPESAMIKMQFASQAPYANWDQPYQDACEEASIIITRYYLDKLNLTKEAINEQILSMVEWQNNNWGGHHNLTSEKTLELAQEFYGLSGEAIYDYDINFIKQKIADGIPVIIPADGKKLNNPNFKNGGPEYHMLVIKGYDNQNFITNDPGTRKGEGYIYPQEVILNSIKNPDNGTKSIFVLNN